MSPLYHFCSPQGQTVCGVPGQVAIASLSWLASTLPARPWGARSWKIHPLLNGWPPQCQLGPGVPDRLSCYTSSMTSLLRAGQTLVCQAGKDVALFQDCQARKCVPSSTTGLSMAGQAMVCRTWEDVPTLPQLSGKGTVPPLPGLNSSVPTSP